jgi:hypothetical protein
MMRRLIFAAAVVFVILAMLAPPGFAQAPAPKVTISGLFDQITSMGRNFYDGNSGRNSDSEWYARTRFRPDFEFAVGRVKAVLGIEIDLMYGQAGANDGGFPGNVSGTNSGCKVNSNGCLDLNSDVGGMLEVKWVYTEFPLTGKDSLLPFIPLETMSRAGGQPWGRLANYKVTYANGDFAGISAVTTYSPMFKSNLAWAIAEDQLAGANRGNPGTRALRGEDYALIASLDITPVKGLDIKPLFSWAHMDGVTNSGSRHHLVDPNFAGPINTTTNSPAALSGGPSATTGGGGDPSFHENRYTIGFDARWRLGAFGLEPTFYYQFGSREHSVFNGTRRTAEISAWILDIATSYSLGPVLLEARGVYAPGNRAQDNLTRKINYFQQFSMDGGYWAGWAALLANGGIDYFNGQLLTNMGRHVMYDRFGRMGLGFRGTWSITPAVAVYTWISPNWTQEQVDIDTGVGAGTGAGSVSRTTLNSLSWVDGESNYIGTEIDLGFTYRFSANAAFDLQGAYLFAGDALTSGEVVGGNIVRKEPQDSYMLAARIRLAF